MMAMSMSHEADQFGMENFTTAIDGWMEDHEGNGLFVGLEYLLDRPTFPCSKSSGVFAPHDGLLLSLGLMVGVKAKGKFGELRDVAAHLPKLVGDLIRIDERGTAFANVVRAALRIRCGKELPTIINVNTGTRKYTLYVRMEKGQPRLPWDEGNEKIEPPLAAPTNILGGKESRPMLSQGAPKLRVMQEEKGKGIMTEEKEARDKRRGRPPGGIIIREDDRRPTELGNMENRSDRPYDRCQPATNRGERMRTQ
ncbi:hypothetical protein J5N97_004391 [Dioscorea zingiberensis]|uniref:Uncharacterized protein n=1 Tax=Dioscorea zingiberensis TaxID=325984 RepID=A0A9D5D8G5_9LILI|nr:hypothetical protein J5N97_004391 [Dioscorea zingiberensis]